MIKASEIIRAAPKYLGKAYDIMDCQAYVEKVLEDAGIHKNLAGSNAWYRYALQHGWVGTPEQCRKKFGNIPKGAFLFILKSDGKEPAKYQKDGIGNANHIGIYTGQTQNQMMEQAFADQGIGQAADRKALVNKAGHGSGAINSSATWGCVATSNFVGKSINGGWNRVWLWTDMIDYSEKEDKHMAAEKATVVLPAGSSGSTVNLREGPGTNRDIIGRVPVGQPVMVLDDQGKWCQIQVPGKTGWMQSNYLEYSEQTDETDHGDQLQKIVYETTIIEEATNKIIEATKIVRDILGKG